MAGSCDDHGGSPLNSDVEHNAAPRPADSDHAHPLERDEVLRLTEFSINSVSDMVAWLSPEGRFLYANDTYCRRLGYTLEELLKMEVYDINPEASRLYRTHWEEVRRRGNLTFESVHRTRTGETYPVEVASNYIRYEGREYNVTLTRDISQRRQVEREAQIMSHAVEHAGLGLIRLDREGRIREVNGYICRLLGFSRDELLGMNAFDITVGLDPAEWPARWKDLQELGPVTFEKEFRTKDDRAIPVEIASSLVEFEGEEVDHGFIRDISDRRRAEEAIRERDEQLRQSHKMEAIGRLAGGIAHDFNNLLTAIIGYSDLILNSESLTGGSAREDLLEIRRAADRAAGLTHQILAFSRRQTLKPRVVALNDLVEETTPLLRRTIGEDIDLIADLSPDPLMVEVDPHQFMQVLMNLVVNARDAMPAGGVLTVRTRTVVLDEGGRVAVDPELAPGAYVEMIVTDTGVGIDPEHLSLIFEPFFTTKDPTEGTGLGLPTAYGVVKQSGGTIVVESSPGEGSTFRVLLPRTEKEPPLQMKRSPLSQTGVPRCAILLVEDEEAVRTLVERVLRGHGCTVYTAENGAQAFAMLESGQFPIDLVVTDVVLPGTLGGEDVARMATATFAGLPVLFISGYARTIVVDEDDIQRNTDFLQKPFTADELVAKVGRMLGYTSPS